MAWLPLFDSISFCEPVCCFAKVAEKTAYFGSAGLYFSDKNKSTDMITK